MGTDADDAALVEILGGVLAHVGMSRGELFHTALGLAHFERIFVDMDRGEDILAYHALVEHDGILIVVPFQGMNATLRLRPRASSPFSVE